MGTFQRFGSYLALILRFSGYAIQNFQGFSKNNSIIKKLYTKDELTKDGKKKKNKKRRGTFNAEDDKQQQLIGNNDEESKNSDEYNKKDKLQREVEARGVFSYKYSRLWCLKYFSSPCCCCFRTKKKREDWLWADGCKKLNEELDVLEIIKKLRVSQFAADVLLKPRQRDLINFFQDYNLDEPQEGGRKIDERRGSRGKKAANMDQLLKDDQMAAYRVYEAVDACEPDKNYYDKLIYERIVNEGSAHSQLGAQIAKQNMDALTDAISKSDQKLSPNQTRHNHQSQLLLNASGSANFGGGS